MAAYSWPLELPQIPEKGYSESIGVNLSRNSVDSGASKLRFIGSRPDEISLSYFMTLAQVELLDTFINSTLRVTAPFDFPHARRKGYNIVPLTSGSYDIPREQLYSVAAPAGTYINDMGILEYSKLNEPRFESDLLLVEPSFTNSIPGSNSFDTWVLASGGTGVTPVITNNIATGPDSFEFSASRVVFNKGAGTTSSDQSILYALVNTIVAEPTSASLWVRSVLPGTVYNFRLDFNGQSTDAPYTSSIVVTDTWTKFKIAISNPIDTVRRITLRLRGTLGTSDYAEVEVFNGSQFLNTTNIYSDIINPTGLTNTRAADVISYKSYLSTPETVEARLLVDSQGKTYSIQELSPNYFRVSLKIELLV